MYNFHYKDIFAYEEGAAAVSDNLISVVMKYSDEENCREQFISSFGYFKERNKYQNQEMNGSTYQLTDRKERHLEFLNAGKYIIAFICEKGQDPEIDKSQFINLFNH